MIASATATCAVDVAVLGAGPAGIGAAVAAHAVEAPALLLATGAVERVLPFPGWTTPGVFGHPVNRRAKVTPDRRAILTPLARSGGLIHALSTARVPH